MRAVTKRGSGEGGGGTCHTRSHIDDQSTMSTSKRSGRMSGQLVAASPCNT